MNRLLAIVFIIALACGVRSEDKPLTEEQKKRVENLKKEIAEKKAELAKLEWELAKIEPPKVLEWKVGSVGNLPLPKGTYHSVVRVHAKGEVVIVRVVLLANNVTVADGTPFLVKGIESAGLKPEMPISLSGRFKVTGEFLLDNKAYRAWDGSSVWIVELQK